MKFLKMGRKNLIYFLANYSNDNRKEGRIKL